MENRTLGKGKQHTNGRVFESQSVSDRCNQFFGNTISREGVKPVASKVETIKKMAIPQDVKRIRRLHGTLNYYRRFVPEMARNPEEFVEERYEGDNDTDYGIKLLEVHGVIYLID